MTTDVPHTGGDGKPKRRGRPPSPAGTTRAAKIDVRTYPDVAEKARLLGTEALEHLIREANDGSQGAATAAKALADARGRSGLTKAQAGKLISASSRTWQQWEAGDRGIPLNALELWLVAAAAEGHLRPDDPCFLDWVRPSIQALFHRR